MAKSALLEQYSDIWFDKQDYLEAERIYYEGKLSGSMGRKNKNKSGASGPAPPLSPAPSPSVSLSDPVPDIDKSVTDILAKPAPLPSVPAPVATPPVVAPVSPAPIAVEPQNDKKLEPKQRNDSESSSKSKKAKGGKGQQPKQDKPQTNNNTKSKTPDRDTNTTLVPETKPVESLLDPPVSSQPITESKKKGGNKAQAANEKMDGIVKLSSGDNSELIKKIAGLESENKSFKKDIQSLQDLVKKLENRINSLEIGGKSAVAPAAKPAPAPAKPAAPANGKAADDDDVDLFGSDSDEESDEAKKIREERLAAYNAKKSKKPVLIAKSNIILDVKPWGDDTDMKEMEKQVRAIEMDGLLWGASKLAPLAYGINKLQISCVVEDEKVSVDALTESIQDIEEYVQSVDIAAFNKV